MLPANPPPPLPTPPPPCRRSLADIALTDVAPATSGNLSCCCCGERPDCDWERRRAAAAFGDGGGAAAAVGEEAKRVALLPLSLVCCGGGAFRGDQLPFRSLTSVVGIICFPYLSKFAVLKILSGSWKIFFFSKVLNCLFDCFFVFLSKLAVMRSSFDR